MFVLTAEAVHGGHITVSARYSDQGSGVIQRSRAVIEASSAVLARASPSSTDVVGLGRVMEDAGAESGISAVEDGQQRGHTTSVLTRAARESPMVEAGWRSRR